MKRLLQQAAATVALAALVPLGACSKEEESDNAAAGKTANRTLAAAIGSAPRLSTASAALSDAGLASVFDGPGSYTVLAPDDDAFRKLGEKGDDLTAPEARPVLVAVLRDHILPGHLTPAAIRKAVTEKGGPVTMRTLGAGTVKFSVEGDAIRVAGDEGLAATVDGAPLAASNGVVIPIDGLLKAPKPQAAQ